MILFFVLNGFFGEFHYIKVIFKLFRMFRTGWMKTDQLITVIILYELIMTGQ